MNEKECKLVQDLLPNYIEKLTSEESNKIIEEHLRKCSECRKILENMQNDIGLKSKEQCKKETKYMKKYSSKLKILKFLGLILLIIVLTFVINTSRKYIIINDLYNKAKIYEIKEDADNYHITQIGIKKGIISYVEEYAKEDKRIRYHSSYSNSEKRNLICEIFYEDENERFKLINDGESKIKDDTTLVGHLVVQNTDTVLDTSLSAVIHSKVEKIKFRDKECYLVQQYLWEYIIEADTGILFRMISEYDDEPIIQDYYKEIGTVQDSDVARPDTAGYIEK